MSKILAYFAFLKNRRYQGRLASVGLELGVTGLSCRLFIQNLLLAGVVDMCLLHMAAPAIKGDLKGG